MQINLDTKAGFCWGVVRTVDKVEEELFNSKGKKVSILGEIIHNPPEIKRLAEIGLDTISKDNLENLSKDVKIVIRAHGEPPETYKKLEELGFEYSDATCPLVKALQTKVRKFYLDGYNIVIFGKKEHAEVIGLRGVCHDNCIVIKTKDEAETSIDFSKKTVLISQTTMDKSTFWEISKVIKSKFEEFNQGIDVSNFFITQDTTCKFVFDREENLRKFSRENDIIIFVAGKNSSNGKSLFNICLSENPKTYFIENIDELNIELLKGVETVGISGATSTPLWYLEEIKNNIIALNIN
jgi:4-hydroxy-3-methylbut-2-en-1-yl diphosphate reductase